MCRNRYRHPVATDAGPQCRGLSQGLEEDRGQNSRNSARLCKCCIQKCFQRFCKQSLQGWLYFYQLLDLLFKTNMHQPALSLRGTEAAPFLSVVLFLLDPKLFFKAEVTKWEENALEVLCKLNQRMFLGKIKPRSYDQAQILFYKRSKSLHKDCSVLFHFTTKGVQRHDSRLAVSQGPQLEKSGRASLSPAEVQFSIPNLCWVSVEFYRLH